MEFIIILFLLYTLKQLSNLKKFINERFFYLEEKLIKLNASSSEKKVDVEMSSVVAEQETCASDDNIMVSDVALKQSKEPEPSLNPNAVDGFLDVNFKESSESSESSEFLRNPSALELILKKIWNWILIGSEKRSKKVSIEYAIASTWLLRLGVIAIVVCVGYFLKWSMDHGILGPWGRISISILSGLVMVVWGTLMTGKKFHLIGQGLIGGGLATLYFSLFAAGPLYDKLAIPMVFLLMIFVTLCAAILAIQIDSMLIALFATVGGFVTPLLLQQSEPDFTILFVYLTLLNIGVIGIAYFKQWRLLNYVSFYFTYSFLLGSMLHYSKPFFSTFMVFSIFAFLVQAVLVYLNNLRQKIVSTSLEIFHLIFNAILFSGIGYQLLMITFGRPYPAILAIGLAVFFIGHIVLFLKNKIQDRALMITFLSLSGFFSVFAVPLIFGQDTIAVFWSLQALMMLWLGLKLKNQFLKGISMLLYTFIGLKVLLSDIPSDYMSRFHVDSFQDYIPFLIDHLWQYGIIIGSFMGAFYFLENSPKPFVHMSTSSDNDTKEWIAPSIYNNIFFWMGSLFVLIFLLLEVRELFSFLVLLQGPAIGLIWIAFGIFFISRWKKTFEDSLLWVGGCFLTIPFLLLFISEFYRWGAGYFIYTHPSSLLFVCARFIEFFILISGCLIAYKLMVKEIPVHQLSSKRQSLISSVLIGVAIFIFWVFLSFELGTVLSLIVPHFKEGGISMLWSIFAMVLLGFGIVKNIKNLRYCGLALFAVVVWKVFVVDLSQMEMIVRVLAFFVVGIILILGAVAYIKGDKTFTLGDKNDST